jgi:lipopolysaccharide transport system ATP-binding protein
MSSDVLVQVEGISKKFCRDLKTSLWYGVKDLTAELAGRSLGNALRNKEFWAVKDVSFTLRRGEALGVIGPNGAGKSTLLKMLNGLIRPNTGSIRMRGRVQGLITLGAGFNPILTGRENVYVNAAVLGIPKREVDKRLAEIIDFAEIGEFIDAPIQSYSSGMTVRLGFAIAINVNPDVLIIDEVLAVGDQRFRRKARNAMARLLESDIAIIFVSHNIHEVLGITQRSLWLDKGNVVKLGDTAAVCAEYVYQSLYDRVPGSEAEFEYMEKRTGELTVIDVACKISERLLGRHVSVDGFNRELVFELTLEAKAPIDEPVFHAINLISLDGTKVGYVMINDYITAASGERVVRRFAANADFLHPGNYQIAYELGTEGGPRLEAIQNLIYLDIKPNIRQLQGAADTAELHYARMIDSGRGAVLLPVTLIR